MNLDKMAEHFSEFSQVQTSPLYAALSSFIAKQPEILAILHDIPLKKSPRTIFFNDRNKKNNIIGDTNRKEKHLCLF